MADNRFAALVGSSEPERVRELAERIASRVRDLAIHHPRSPSSRYVSLSIGLGSEVPEWGASETCLL
ncbi:MAG: GGDEF domain-containing protein, partial [Gammaproteobacteria bacterium]|nr:GGDEF domain-containing protein [Gammaproteobacteria bacterium]